MHLCLDVPTQVSIRKIIDTIFFIETETQVPYFPSISSRGYSRAATIRSAAFIRGNTVSCNHRNCKRRCLANTSGEFAIIYVYILIIALGFLFANYSTVHILAI